MSEPLRITFDVACSVEHAFAVWTSGIDAWWPRDHTVTAEPGLVVVLQGGVGGRIYERTADGAEHDWGEVTAWDPPMLLGYQWHLGQDPADATEVEVRFVPLGEPQRGSMSSTVAGTPSGLARRCCATATASAGTHFSRTTYLLLRKESLDGDGFEGRSVGAQTPPGTWSTRCTRTTRPTRRHSSARSDRPR